MRTIPLLSAAAVLLATPVAAHESQDGSPCHMAEAPMSTGTIVTQWHCHKAPDVEAMERVRKAGCESRLKKLRRAIAQLGTPYGKRKLAKKCVDRTSPAGKAICATAEKRHAAVQRGLQAAADMRRRKAAELCKLGEMIK